MKMGQHFIFVQSVIFVIYAELSINFYLCKRVDKKRKKTSGTELENFRFVLLRMTFTSTVILKQCSAMVSWNQLLTQRDATTGSRIDHLKFFVHYVGTIIACNSKNLLHPLLNQTSGYIMFNKFFDNP